MLGEFCRLIACSPLGALSLIMLMTQPLQALDPSNAEEMFEDLVFTSPVIILSSKPAAANAPGYVVISNHSQQPRRLIAARSPIADHVEFHHLEIVTNKAVSHGPMEAGLELPVNARLVPESGGFYILFREIESDLPYHQPVPVYFTLENGTEFMINFTIRPARSRE